MKLILHLFLAALWSVFVFGSDIRGKRQALFDVQKWTNNTMTYFYNDNLPYEMRAIFRDAFNYLQSHTCLKFVNDPYATTAVNIKLGDGCYSEFGMNEGRLQDLSFGYPCGHFGVAVHETMHALGIAHSQSRGDRDQYLFVNSNDHNDGIMQTDVTTVPFDYGSVMLYAMSNSRYPKDPEHKYTMGSLRVAFYDMIMLNKFYNCNCDSHPTKLNCKNGGYPNPSNCDKCLCTDGFKGTECDELDGFVLAAETEWQSNFLDHKIDAHYSLDRSTAPQNVFVHITAPEGSTIEVRTTVLKGFFCHYTCDFNGVELKYKTDRRIVSPLTCCDIDDLWNKTRSSTNNPFVIVQYGDNKATEFHFEYRYLPGNSTKV